MTNDFYQHISVDSEREKSSHLGLGFDDDDRYLSPGLSGSAPASVKSRYPLLRPNNSLRSLIVRYSATRKSRSSGEKLVYLQDHQAEQETPVPAAEAVDS